MWTTTRTAATALDEEDPLAGLRSRYNPSPGAIHLDGNSTGPPTSGAAVRARRFVDHRWARPSKEYGPHPESRLAARGLAPLVGAEADEIAIADSTSMNLFKALLAGARLRPRRSVLMVGRDCFPTDRYLARSAADLTDNDLVLLENADELPDVLEGAAIVALSHVDSRSGAVRDTAATTERIHRAGALALWDLSNSAGALHVDLHAWDADFAIGCGDKYLGGGPGAPAYGFVARRHHPEPTRTDTGIQTTSPTLSVSGFRESLSVLSGVSTSALQAKTSALVELFLARVTRYRDEFGIEVLDLPAGTSRGTQVVLRHRHAQHLVQGLFARGVVADFAEPDLLRFGFSPSWLGYVDVWEAVEELGEVLHELDHA